MSNAKYFCNRCFSFVALLFLSSRAFFFRALYPHWSTVDSSLHSFPLCSLALVIYIFCKLWSKKLFIVLYFTLCFLSIDIFISCPFPPLKCFFFVFSQIPFFYKDIDGQLSYKKKSLAFLNQPFILGLSTRKRKETERWNPSVLSTAVPNYTRKEFWCRYKIYQLTSTRMSCLR